jgi:hypothetical protein
LGDTHFPAPGTPRPLGSLKGKVEILPGFDEYDEEITAMFEGSEIEPEP